MYIASVSYGCCKIDRDVAYVAMVVHVCCKRLFPIFHLFFRRVLQVCLSGCCICFTHMLQVFYQMLHMFAVVFKYCQVFFQMFQTHVSSVSSVFFCMLQLLHLDVSKIDRGVAHGMRVGSSQRRGPTTGALAREPDAPEARSLPVRATSRRSSKSPNKFVR